VVLVGGFFLGLVLGRWWALLASAGLGLWVASTSEVEVSASYLGLVYAVISGLAIVLGIALRRVLSTRGRRSDR
jgi:hypothetical protein